MEKHLVSWMPTSDGVHVIFFNMFESTIVMKNFQCDTILDWIRLLKDDILIIKFWNLGMHYLTLIENRQKEHL